MRRLGTGTEQTTGCPLRLRVHPVLSVMLALAVAMAAGAPSAAAIPTSDAPPPAGRAGSVAEDSDRTHGPLVGEQSVLLPGIPPELLPPPIEAEWAEPPSSAFRPQALGAFAPAPCFVPLPEGVADGEDVRCGFVTVPLRYAESGDPAGGETIQIATAVIEATGPAPTEDPLLILSGGPGEPLTPALPVFANPASPYAALAARRDVVLLDQRGTGFSQPSLQCPEIQQVTTVDPEEQQAAVVDALAACHDRLVAEGKEPSAYTTLNNARDLDVVREALGYETWNVYGTSYGTLLALNYARLFAGADAPDGEGGPIRTLTLSSAIPAEENFYLDVAAGFQRALDRTFEACAADPDCRAAFEVAADASAKDLQAVLDRLIDRLGEAPAEFGLLIPAAGPDAPAQTVDVTLLEETVASLLFQAYYALPFIPFVAPLVERLEAGDYEELFQLFPPTGIATGVALGMQLSVLCAEQVADTTAEELRASAEGTSDTVRVFLEANPIVGLTVFDVCAQWEVDPADPVLFDPVETTVPTLVVAGLFDHITPPEYGRQLAEDLPNAVLVEVPDAGHSPLLSIGACGVAIQNAFYADPESSPDDSCAKERVFEPAATIPTLQPLGSRVAGSERFATAGQVARRAFPQGADDVVLATGEAFPDALAAAGFAGAVDGPILLTRGDALPEATADALATLDPEVVHIAGGTDAVAETVTAQLAESYTVRRYGGANRYETAATLAQSMTAITDAPVGEVNGLPTAIIATGDTFADALAGGPLAFAGTHPILLVDDGVPTATADALRALGIRQVLILGGTAAVPQSVAAALEAIVGGPSIRLAGATRDATAAAVAAMTLALFEAEADSATAGDARPERLDTVLLARNDAFADALAGGPLGGRHRAPILLTAPSALPDATAATLGALSDQVNVVRALGGSAAITDPVLAAAVASLRPSSGQR